jgi:hypothetical protein
MWQKRLHSKMPARNESDNVSLRIASKDVRNAMNAIADVFERNANNEVSLSNSSM